MRTVYVSTDANGASPKGASIPALWGFRIKAGYDRNGRNVPVSGAEAPGLIYTDYPGALAQPAGGIVSRPIPGGYPVDIVGVDPNLGPMKEVTVMDDAVYVPWNGKTMRGALLQNGQPNALYAVEVLEGPSDAFGPGSGASPIDYRMALGLGASHTVGQPDGLTQLWRVPAGCQYATIALQGHGDTAAQVGTLDVYGWDPGVGQLNQNGYFVRRIFDNGAGDAFPFLATFVPPEGWAEFFLYTPFAPNHAYIDAIDVRVQQ